MYSTQMVFQPSVLADDELEADELFVNCADAVALTARRAATANVLKFFIITFALIVYNK